MSAHRTRPRRTRRLQGILGALATCAACLLSLVTTAPAFGAVVSNERPFLFAFNGADTNAGAFTEPTSVAVDNASGAIYVANSGQFQGNPPGSVCRFHPDGAAWDFPATGAPCLSSGGDFPFSNELRIAVDNSGVNPGRFYVLQFGNSRLYGFTSSGEYLWSLTPEFQFADVAVDPTGHPWTVTEAGKEAKKYASTGSPPVAEAEFKLPFKPRVLDFDKSGNCYLQDGVAVQKFGSCNLNSSPSVFDSQANDVYVDQTSTAGHILTAGDAPGDIQEYDAGGTLLGTFGTLGNYLSASTSGPSISYLPSSDRIYVAQALELSGSPHVVAVFGPKLSGTVPDTSVDPVLGVNVSCAQFSGTVNPQGVNNAWQFEWRVPGQSWASAGHSPKFSLPVDSSDHEVEYATCALRGKTTFDVRVVGINTDNGLRGISAAEEFTTDTPDVPGVEIDPVSAISKDSFHVSGAVDPMEDETKWQVQVQAGGEGPGCTGALSTFTPTVNNPILFEEKFGAREVEYDVTGLLPAERYCVSISAENGGGNAVSSIEEVETEATPPSQVETSFAAPRLDTSARINARVNPQGAPLAYRFEYSEDGGASWIALPQREDTSKARSQILVDDKLSGLVPGSTYLYRLSSAENSAGPAISVPDQVKSFTTRTTMEIKGPSSCPNEDTRVRQRTAYLGFCRGIELVNSPDKGNQNARPRSIETLEGNAMTSDGEKALWTLTGGSPGGNTATGDTYLATRTTEGWKSTSLIPSAADQFGKSKFKYEYNSASADFTRFLFTTLLTDTFSLKPVVTLLRLDAKQNEEVLGEEGNVNPPGNIEFTSDGSHAVGVNVQSPSQIEDVGGETPEVVSVMPDGEPSSCGVSFKGATAFALGKEQRRPGYRVVSSDASRIYFQAMPNKPGQPKKCDSAGLVRLYERNREAEETVLIDAGGFGHDPELIRAAPDGKSAYFVTYSNHSTYKASLKGMKAEELARVANLDADEADKNEHADIYRWGEIEGKAVCLTCAVGADVNVPENSPVAVSDDFTHIYFLSREQLVPGQGQATPDGAKVFLYVLSDERVRLVAEVPSDEPPTKFSTGRLSRDGSILAFRATPSPGLTTDSVAKICPNLIEGAEAPGPCTELYLYDDLNGGSLECVSCAADGQTTHTYGSPTGGLVGLPGFFGLSEDGSTVAFTTAEALAPRDVNDDTDVYEWRDGAVRLITDGVSDFQKGPAAPAVASIDADGSDIMFSVVSRGLTGFEHDGLANLYDARIGGGFIPPSPSFRCSEDSCQGPLQGTPPIDRAGTFTYAGTGNTDEGQSRCSEGKVRRRGRCVKRPKRRQDKQRSHRRLTHVKDRGSK